MSELNILARGAYVEDAGLNLAQAIPFPLHPISFLSSFLKIACPKITKK